MKAIGIGAGGHAKILADIVRQMGEWELIGLLDANVALRGRTVAGLPVLGGDELLPELFRDGVRHAFLGIGTVGETQSRRAIYERVTACGYAMIRAIHPSAVVAPSARLGAGPTVSARAVINAEAVLGDNVIVNTGAIIEHDCVIGSHSHIASGACLSSTVRVGEGVHVGAGAVIRQCVTVGEGAIIGAGAVVVRDVAAWTVVVGVPARVLRRGEPALRNGAAALEGARR